MTPATGRHRPGRDSVTVTFSEPVAARRRRVRAQLRDRRHRVGPVTGGPTTFTLDPTADLVDGDACTLTVTWRPRSPTIDANDPPDTMAADYTSTFSTPSRRRPCTCPEHHGDPGLRGGTAAVIGELRTDPRRRGRRLRGPLARAARLLPAGPDAATATPPPPTAIFVFNGSNADAVELGDLVRVTGTVGENQGQTQVTVAPATTSTKCGTGTVTPDRRDPARSRPPTSSSAYEGMLVRLPQTLS